MSPEHPHTIEFIAGGEVLNIHYIGDATRLPRIGEEVSLPGPDENSVTQHSYLVTRVIHHYAREESEPPSLSIYYRKVSIYLGD